MELERRFGAESSDCRPFHSTLELATKDSDQWLIARPNLPKNVNSWPLCTGAVVQWAWQVGPTFQATPWLSQDHVCVCVPLLALSLPVDSP